MNSTTLFTQLDLSSALHQAIEECGYIHPTPVQEKTIPLAIQGMDLMIQSQTGTGKTAAFMIPVIEHLLTQTSMRALILAPTRELARQVTVEAQKLCKFTSLEVSSIYGGVPIEKQFKAVKHHEILVGTPGRVVDHLRRKTLNLKNFNSFVLDEADEMLSMGFMEELNEITQALPKSRHTLFFSATFPASVKRYAHRFLNQATFLSFLDENSSADELDHLYYMTQDLQRTTTLIRVLEQETPDNAIIFANTRREVDLIARILKKKGYDIDQLSGNLEQKSREKVMAKMRENRIRYLVATDVAARGIDLSDLSHVIHYSLPPNYEIYTHRSGRTGRAGKSGVVISLIGPREIGLFYEFKTIHHLPLVERTLEHNNQSNSLAQSSQSSSSSSSSSAPSSPSSPLSPSSPSSQSSSSSVKKVNRTLQKLRAHRLKSPIQTSNVDPKPPSSSQDKKSTHHENRIKSRVSQQEKQQLQEESGQKSNLTPSDQEQSHLNSKPKRRRRRKLDSPIVKTTKEIKETLSAKPKPSSSVVDPQPLDSSKNALLQVLQNHPLFPSCSGDVPELQAILDSPDLPQLLHLLTHLGQFLPLRSPSSHPSSPSVPPIQKQNSLALQHDKKEPTFNPQPKKKPRRRWIKFKLNLGLEHFQTLAHFKEWLFEESGLSTQEIRAIQCTSEVTYLQIHHEYASDFVLTLQGEDWQDRLIQVERL